jgi:hypothetical protein
MTRRAIPPLVLLAALLACCPKLPKDTSDSEEVPARTRSGPKSPEKKEVHGIANVGDMLEAYKTNQVAADEKYKGKRWRIAGPVDRVTNGMFGGIDVHISPRGGRTLFTVSCNFRKSSPWLTGLKKGDEATMAGDCTGGTTLGVRLSDCEQ